MRLLIPSIASIEAIVLECLWVFWQLITQAIAVQVIGCSNRAGVADKQVIN
jgi:hypothetical protein